MTLSSRLAEAIWSFVSVLPATWSRPPAGRELLNDALNQRWDQVRWLIAAHYKFNTRLDTPFWRDARENTDLSGFQHQVDMYEEVAPLSRRDGLIQDMLNRVSPTTFSLYGLDNIWLGMQKPTRRRLPMDEPVERWQARYDAAQALADKALPVRRALAAYAEFPELNRQLLEDDDSWAGRRVAAMMGML